MRPPITRATRERPFAIGPVKLVWRLFTAVSQGEAWAKSLDATAAASASAPNSRQSRLAMPRVLRPAVLVSRSVSLLILIHLSPNWQNRSLLHVRAGCALAERAALGIFAARRICSLLITREKVR